MTSSFDWIWSSPKLAQLAEANLKRYFATLHKLLVEDHKTYDVILAAGNSGLIMARYAQMLYEHLGLDTPIVIKVAPQRYEPGKEEVSDNLMDNSILYVDDEIGEGTTIHACADMLKRITPDGNRLLIDIVAEDQEYVPSENWANINISLIPFAHEIDGLNNIVMYLIPQSIHQALGSTDDSCKKKVAVLLGIPSRSKQQLLDGFDYSMNYLKQKEIANLENLMTEFQQYIADIMIQGIDEYKQGKIDLGDDSYRNEYLVKD